MIPRRRNLDHAIALASSACNATDAQSLAILAAHESYAAEWRVRVETPMQSLLDEVSNEQRFSVTEAHRAAFLRAFASADELDRALVAQFARITALSPERAQQVSDRLERARLFSSCADRIASLRLPLSFVDLAGMIEGIVTEDTSLSAEVRARLDTMIDVETARTLALLRPLCAPLQRAFFDDWIEASKHPRDDVHFNGFIENPAAVETHALKSRVCDAVLSNDSSVRSAVAGCTEVLPPNLSRAIALTSTIQTLSESDRDLIRARYYIERSHRFVAQLRREAVIENAKIDEIERLIDAECAPISRRYSEVVADFLKSKRELLKAVREGPASDVASDVASEQVGEAESEPLELEPHQVSDQLEDVFDQARARLAVCVGPLLGDLESRYITTNGSVDGVGRLDFWMDDPPDEWDPPAQTSHEEESADESEMQIEERDSFAMDERDAVPDYVPEVITTVPKPLAVRFVREAAILAGVELTDAQFDAARKRAAAAPKARAREEAEATLTGRLKSLPADYPDSRALSLMPVIEAKRALLTATFAADQELYDALAAQLAIPPTHVFFTLLRFERCELPFQDDCGWPAPQREGPTTALQAIGFADERNELLLAAAACDLQAIAARIPVRTAELFEAKLSTEGIALRDGGAFLGGVFSSPEASWEADRKLYERTCARECEVFGVLLKNARIAFGDEADALRVELSLLAQPWQGTWPDFRSRPAESMMRTLRAQSSDPSIAAQLDALALDYWRAVAIARARYRDDPAGHAWSQREGAVGFGYFSSMNGTAPADDYRNTVSWIEQGDAMTRLCLALKPLFEDNEPARALIARVHRAPL